MKLATVRAIEEMRDRCEALPWSGCWIWMRAVDSGGYGSIMVDRKGWSAHRYIWTLAFGPIPKGLHVLHRCDVPSCINPEHLWLGTRADNQRDASAKGRLQFPKNVGEKNHFAKLRAENVSFILGSEQPNSALAKLFNVTPGAISQIRMRRCWRHITERN